MAGGRAFAFVATAILAAAICAAAEPARPVSPPAGHLVVAMALDGDSDVYALSSDVARLAALTSNHTSDGALMSADRKALLVGPGAGPAGLRLVDPAGKPVGPGVPGGLWGVTVPSPDGSWLLSRELLVRTDGTARRSLGIPWNGPTATAWAPDSSAFMAVLPERIAAYAVAHPASPRVVVRVAADGVAWSPDSRLLAYADGRGAIWSVDARRAGARPHLVMRIAGNRGLGDPRWSADGRWLSYAGASNGLGLVRSTGGTPTRLTKDAWRAVWSPRGAQIAYMQPATASARAGIVVATPGAAPRRIADVVGDSYGLVWSPDGTALAFYERHGMTVVDVATRTSWHTVLLDPWAELVGWRDAPFPDTARRVALRPSERLVHGELRFPSKVRTIAAEGSRVAALVAGIGYDRGYIVAWTPKLPPTRLTFDAGPNGGGEKWLSIGMSSQEVLWQSAYCGNNCYFGFGAVTPDGRSEFWEEADIGPSEENDPYRDIFRIGFGPRGDGATVVYSNLDGSVLARTCTAPKRCTTRRVTAAEGPPLAIGGGNVIVATRADVRVVTLAGTLLRTLPEGSAYALAGDRVLVQRDQALEVYGLKAGKALKTIALPTGRTLADAEGDLVALRSDDAIVVRSLRTGRFFALPARTAVAAQLEPSGLSYAYNTTGPEPGRVAFVPMSALEARLSPPA